MAIVELKNVSRVYTSGDHELKALDGVNLSLDEGKFVVILGPSGAGKSTLLNLLGGLDSPTSGRITVCGKDISTLTQNELADYRAETVGFVFQFYNLIPTLTVHENVTLVKEIVKNPLSATKMLEEVGLADHAKKLPVGTFGRGAAACFHCESAREESENSFMRRADGRARFRNRRACIETSS